MRTVGKIAVWCLAIAAALPALLYAAHLASPWPSALVIRALMDRGGTAMERALQRHVPAGVETLADLQYDPGDPGDPDARLDLHRPEAAAGRGPPLPAIVWIHGGAFVSGGKAQVASYARILASHGFAVAAIGYSLAPGARYPNPVRQANAALAYLAAHSASLGIDPSRVVLAGDSAGAQAAAQLAAIVSSPVYARATGIVPAISRDRLAGALLFCGIYDGSLLKGEGAFALFLDSVGRSYFGGRDFLASPALAEFSVTRHVTADFPPAFISAGNADPLLPHSIKLAEALEAKGVRVDRLFFPAGHRPPLQHEYQFDLDIQAGQLALTRAVAFLKGLSR